MAKKLMQDMIVRDKKNIQLPRRDTVQKPAPVKISDIPVRIPKEEFPASFSPKPIPPAQTSTEDAPRIFFPEKKKLFDEDFSDNGRRESVSKKSHTFLWTISIAAVAILLFVFSLLFATATVTITPKKEPIILNATYTISATSSIAGLPYTILPVQKTISQSLPTNGEKNVTEQGTGQATIYNDYSSSVQRIIINTRLETSGGVIYRTRASVNVPGMTTVKGVKTPGSITVPIISDLPGSQYDMNISDLKGDFTIPDFQGTAKYTGFYARLSGDVTGGFIGTVKTVDPSVLSAARQTLINTVSADVLQEAYATLTPAQTILNNNYFLETTNLPDTPTGSSYTITEQANLYAIVFNTNQLASFIAKNTSSDYDGTSSVSILWNNDISATSTGMTVTPWLENSLKMQMSGDADIVWSYNASEILNEIKGQSKSVLQNILNENKNAITEIQADIRPEWKTTFPADPSKITIINAVLSGQN